LFNLNYNFKHPPAGASPVLRHSRRAVMFILAALAAAGEERRPPE